MANREKRTLAEGEVTGHAHVLDVSEVTFDDDIGIFETEHGDVVRHEEHGPIALPPGKYASGRVQEYDHFSEEAKAVQD